MRRFRSLVLIVVAAITMAVALHAGAAGAPDAGAQNSGSSLVSATTTTSYRNASLPQRLLQDDELEMRFVGALGVAVDPRRLRTDLSALKGPTPRSPLPRSRAPVSRSLRARDRIVVAHACTLDGRLGGRRGSIRAGPRSRRVGSLGSSAALEPGKPLDQRSPVLGTKHSVILGRHGYVDALEVVGRRRRSSRSPGALLELGGLQAPHAHRGSWRHERAGRGALGGRAWRTSSKGSSITVRFKRYQRRLDRPERRIAPAGPR